MLNGLDHLGSKSLYNVEGGNKNMKTNLKFWKGWAVWQIVDPEKKEVFTKMKWFGKNFNLKKTKEVKGCEYKRIN